MKPVYILKMGNNFVRIKSSSMTIVEYPWQGSIYNRAADAEYQTRQGHWLNYNKHWLNYNNEIAPGSLRVVEILFDVKWESDWTGKSVAKDEIPL